MANFSKRIIYLTEAQRKELFLNETITVDGVTINYNENDIYVTPQEMSMTIGQVTTLAPGANATASISGDPEDMTLSLGIPQGATGAKGDKGDTYTLTTADKEEIAGIVAPTIERISDTDPVITAEDNHMYICGEVTSLDFTPCATGICDVRFTSGSTVTVLTLPSTVSMPDGFVVETNRIYELNFLDGLGVYQSWQIST